MRYKLVVTQIEHHVLDGRQVRDILATDLPIDINIEEFLKKLSKLVWEGKC